MQLQDILNNLFRTIKQPKTLTPKVVGKGSIITFYYAGQTLQPIHDVQPLIIVSDLFTDMIRGINLHYLNMPIVRDMLTNPNFAGNVNFSYKTIIGNDYLIGSFRSYKRLGISGLRMLDVEYMRNLLVASQALNIGELEQIRQQVKNLIQKVNNQIRAEDYGR